MLLALTNSQDATADYLLSVFVSHQIPFVRFDTDLLVSRLQFSYRLGSPELYFEGKRLLPEEIHSVWYRRPERLRCEDIADTPEGKYILEEWAEGLESFLAHIPMRRWINHPSVNSLASHKLEQLSTASELGFQVPDTLVTQDEDMLRYFFERHGGRLIVKPMAVGYVTREDNQNDSLIFTNRVSHEDLHDLADLKVCPTLFQEFITKARDIRITVVDNACHAVELIAHDEDGRQRCDIRRNNMADVAYKEILIPETIRNQIFRLMECYSLRFAAIDMVESTDGVWYFLEVNPNGQWAWLDIEGITNIAGSFARAFSSDKDSSICTTPGA